MDTFFGAAATALAYVLGQLVLGSYLASSWRFTAGGQLGGLLAFLVWTYYTSIIVLGGAVLSRRIVLARLAARGELLEPAGADGTTS